MQRDTVAFTFTVATVLCVVCSLMVASTAEALKSKIGDNERLDRQKNILLAAGLAEASASADEINEIFQEKIDPVHVDLATGDAVPEEELPPGYDADKASKDPKLQVPVLDNALMGVRYREPIATAYKLEEGGYVLPVYGNGLWGTLWGFLALESDARTVKGITFYKHKETPGLGAEVDNPEWKALWPGKQAFDDEGNVLIQVKKGQVPSDSPEAAYTIDGLSGATITTKGVDHLVSYWLGDEGFGKYLAQQ